jgi:hypothetical protein
MGIELPAELADVAAKAGVQWPQADEEAMRSSAQAWRQAGTTIDAVAKDADGSANKALAAVTGDTGTAAQQHWHTFVAPDTGHLTSTAKGCLDAADRLDHAADQVGAAKVRIVKHLVTLAKHTDAADAAAAAGHPAALAGLHATVHQTASSVAQVNHSLTTSIRLDHTPAPQAVPAQVTNAAGTHDPLGTHDLLGAQGPLGGHGPVDVVGTVAPVVGGSGHPGHIVDVGGLGADHTGPIALDQIGPASHPGSVGGVGQLGPVGQLDPVGHPGEVGGVEQLDPIGQLGSAGHPGSVGGAGQLDPVGQPDPSGQLGAVGVAPVDVGAVGAMPASPVLPGHHAGSPGAFDHDPHGGEPTPPMGVTVQSAAPAPVAPSVDLGQSANVPQPVAHQPMPPAPTSFSAPTPSFGTPVVAAPPPLAPPPAPAPRGGNDLIGAVDVQRPGPAVSRQGPRSAAVPPAAANPNVLPDVTVRPTRPDARREAVALFLVYLFPIGQLPRASTRPDRQLPPPARETDFAAGLRFEPHDHPDSALIDPEIGTGTTGTTGAHPGFAAEDPEVLAMTYGYDPLGGEPERDWDRRFLVRPADREGRRAAEYAWPPGELFPEGGCAAGEPVVLAEGTVVDRFGTPEGRVFGEDGTPFARRSLPPDHLAAGYHRYRVTRALPMWRTLSAPWFGQPGGGVRYRAVHPAADLVAMGHLTEITGTDNGH